MSASPAASDREESFIVAADSSDDACEMLYQPEEVA
jgi:hypothetical protein